MENQENLTEEEFLRNYDSSKYKKPSVTVDNIIFCINNLGDRGTKTVEYFNYDMEVLLIKRGNYPDKGKWAFPGGFIEMDENLEESALRELREETSIEEVEFQQLQAFGDVGRDKRDRIITVAYLALIKEKKEAKAGDDAKEASWFKVKCRKTVVNENDGEYILDIYLSNNELEICPKVKVISKRGYMLENKRYEIIDKSEIAGDHAKLLSVAIERVKEIEKLKINGDR
ncbi:NUDIX hydrolase [Clostridium sp. 'White wine YQ']|uniref:NUDIX hydrolase n=1 Tax=Clostridium sp. 'White wine YQ' TaxID=3027474 RepID=UPI002366B120|nr:NUDIX hydrolase [Clostridium sp. 'White wine YQ']MDD7794569.1 NUDIX hydrolase [Clostridium sp. 'White wine YQ']